jgi:uncharacterized surface protein with fasciclin (FAS1) repeats
VGRVAVVGLKRDIDELVTAKVVKLTTAKTLNGASVKIAVKGKSVFLNGSTKVTKTDVKASNGIIHVINKVLLPPA